MASETPKRVSIWSYHQAPPEYQKSFPDSGPHDWVVYVPQSEREVLEPSLLRWRDVYPVRSAELPDCSVVYCGAPREAVGLVGEEMQTPHDRLPAGGERRRAVRVPISYPLRYETQSALKQAGIGRTIDMSTGGIAFTTESWLPANANVTLRVEWPVKLEGEVPIELQAAGRLTRTEAMMAALQLDHVSFSTLE
jgi:hypothetical protein